VKVKRVRIYGSGESIASTALLVARVQVKTKEHFFCSVNNITQYTVRANQTTLHACMSPFDEAQDRSTKTSSNSGGKGQVRHYTFAPANLVFELQSFDSVM
jgi:hypothetical protein